MSHTVGHSYRLIPKGSKPWWNMMEHDLEQRWTKCHKFENVLWDYPGTTELLWWKSWVKFGPVLAAHSSVWGAKARQHIQRRKKDIASHGGRTVWRSCKKAQRKKVTPWKPQTHRYIWLMMVNDNIIWQAHHLLSRNKLQRGDHANSRWHLMLTVCRFRAKAW